MQCHIWTYLQQACDLGCQAVGSRLPLSCCKGRSCLARPPTLPAVLVDHLHNAEQLRT